jgi:hypothetical protein
LKANALTWLGSQGAAFAYHKTQTTYPVEKLAMNQDATALEEKSKFKNGSRSDFLAYCNLEDPLNERWLWAQATGLALSIAIFVATILSFTNILVMAYTAVMAKICNTEFRLDYFNCWQDNASSLALIAGAIIAVGASFLRVWLGASFGSPSIKRSIRLALNIEDTLSLCRSLSPIDTTLSKDVSNRGKITLHTIMGRSFFSTRHLVLRIVAIDANETAVIIQAAPLLNNQLQLLSAFFCDFGVNRQQVASIVQDLKPYMLEKRQSEAEDEASATNIPTDEKVLREAPPKLGKPKNKLVPITISSNTRTKFFAEY